MQVHCQQCDTGIRLACVLEVYRPKDTAKVNSLEGCYLELEKVFR